MSQKIFKNSEKISRTAQECFDVLRKNENKFSEEWWQRID